MRLRTGRPTGALAIALTLSAVVLPAGTAAHADPDALWQLVSQQCVPDEEQFDDPAPCAAVDLDAGVERGFAVFKDSVGPRQFLLIPTARITGIESPELLAPDAPNYFSAAWRARSFTDAAAGGPVPRDWMSLAVNSIQFRSQNQLHIHVDCVRGDVHDALSEHGAQIGPTWTTFPVPLAGHTYSALGVEGADLDVNPFQLVADAFGSGDMGSQTVVVIGRDRGDGGVGFVILADRADGENGDFAGGEQLQDHDYCGGAPLSVRGYPCQYGVSTGVADRCRTGRPIR